MAAVWLLLVYVVLPLWVVAGFVDYLCHRATDIEHASGVRESLIHWLMVAEVGVPLGLAVFFRIDALVVAVMIVFLIAHELTGYLDLKLAMATRRVSIFEHQVHSMLEVLPLTALFLVMALHWPQTQALFGFGSEPADFGLRYKNRGRWNDLVPPAMLFLLFVIGPYAEELWRGSRARRHHL